MLTILGYHNRLHPRLFDDHMTEATYAQRARTTKTMALKTSIAVCQDSMSKKYCDHYYTHGCNAIVESYESTCAQCSQGNC
jgi:hypothetical protein